MCPRRIIIHIRSFRRLNAIHSAGRGQAAFDFSAAPVAVHREPQDQSFFGLPGLKFFGAHFQSKHLIALLAATLFLGWKGFALGLGVWIFYKLSQKPQGEAHTSRAPTRSLHLYEEA